MSVQHNGVAMGALLAPVIADIFMGHTEIADIFMGHTEIDVSEWHIYVDDIFVLIEPTTNESDILHILNNFHPSIKLT
jgi:hypothetical protein